MCPRCFFISALLATSACGANTQTTPRAQGTETPAPRTSFESGQPADARELARFEQAAAYSKENRGLSTLILRDGKIIFESYYNGHAVDKPQALASGTKSFCGLLAAAAVQDGLISYDELVSDTIEEWKNDPRKSKITVRQLLSLTSGIQGGRLGRVPTYSEAVEAPAIEEPGVRFLYGPNSFQVFGELMRRKLMTFREDPVTYLRRRVLTPIQMEISQWRIGADGFNTLSSGVSITSREWAKFGELIRNHGYWNGQEIIATETLAECFKGSKANPAYGLSFWLNLPYGEGPTPELAKYIRRKQGEVAISPHAPRDLIMAAGAGKERLYIIPSLKLVIVHQAQSITFKDDVFLSLVLGSAPQSDAASDVPRTLETP
ncbi:MAG: serine hydrolase [Planctomycetota bacterium]